MSSLFSSPAKIATAIVIGAMTGLASLKMVQAANFEQKEVDQTKFVAIAAPVGTTSHQLLIVEQINNKQQCWGESSGGTGPVAIDPLLAKFDFTGICGRSTDANGYSIRQDGQDLGGKYTLRIRYRDGDMVLVGAPDNKQDPEIVVGRANGMSQGFVKIQLESGWRFTKRMFVTMKDNKRVEKVLGHVYLTRETGAAPPPAVGPFNDVAGNIYLKEIQQAVSLKFIAGFKDNTFQPKTALTREQLVSMVLDALKTVPGVQLAVADTAAKNPYSDVDAKRWSAAKIAFAQTNNIVKGYPDGTFQPTKPVSRAELMAVMQSAAKYAKTLQQKPADLTGTQAVFEFADTQGHWSADLVKQMSAYCGVASPVNEVGKSFGPNQPAQRDYAAAATLRTLNCLKQ
jgi:N-acetylmuramoyl-L-alanine amidase